MTNPGGAASARSRCGTAAAVELLGELLGDLQRTPADRLGQRQRGVRGPVAVVALFGRLELHPAGRFRQTRVREGSAHRVCKVVTDHGESASVMEICVCDRVFRG